MINRNTYMPLEEVVDPYFIILKDFFFFENVKFKEIMLL